MPENKPISYSGLDISRIRFADYTRSLLDEGVRSGLIGEDGFTADLKFLFVGNGHIGNIHIVFF